ncbi:MAG: hypothetical protein AB7K24_05585, partial [Gemmataceae bacterium]
MANGQQQIVRVYLCAAYRDMQAERAYLHAHVFPRVTGLFAQKGCRLEIVDPCLRRSEEVAEGMDGLELGLDVIENCKPFFLGFVGTRDNQIVDHVPLVIGRKYPALRDYSRCSRLQLETIHGVLREPAAAWGSFFYFRSGTFIKSIPEADRARWLPEDRMEGHRLGAFKKAIRSTRRPVFEYDCEYREETKTLAIATRLGEQVTADLLSLLPELARRPLPAPKPIASSVAAPAAKPIVTSPSPAPPKRPVLPRDQKPKAPLPKAPVRAPAPSNLLSEAKVPPKPATPPQVPKPPERAEPAKPPTMHSIRLPDMPREAGLPRGPLPTMPSLSLPELQLPDAPAQAATPLADQKPASPPPAAAAQKPAAAEQRPPAPATPQAPAPPPRAEARSSMPAKPATPAAPPPARVAPKPAAAPTPPRVAKPSAPAQKPAPARAEPKPATPPPPVAAPPRAEAKPPAAPTPPPRVEQKPVEPKPTPRVEDRPPAAPPRVEKPATPTPPAAPRVEAPRVEAKPPVAPTPVPRVE